MSDVTLSVTVPKEVQDVLSSVLDLVAKLQAKTPLPQLLAAELPVLVQLLGEVQALPAEVKAESAASVDAALLFSRKLVYQILGKA